MNQDDSIPMLEPLRLPAQIKALVVDDDVFQQALVSDVLHGLDIGDVAVASSGDSAVKLLEVAVPPFNLLVIDLSMPGMDGFQFMDTLAKVGYKGALLIVSGQNTEVMRAASMVAKWRCFHLLGTLRKPLVTQDLAQLIADAQSAG